MAKEIKNLDLLKEIAQIVFDKKGSNIIGLDLQALSCITDYVLIGEGQSERHVIAMEEEIIKKLKEKNYQPIYSEGNKSGEWTVIDFFNIIVHLMIPSFREKYQLEKLWKESRSVDLEINVHH